jgi:hypothetical protein
MADEENTGASYLASLRQSTPPQAAGATPARPGPGSADKRKSPRYKCKGSARIQEIGSMTSTWATFADISMYGCYVESATPLRVHAAIALKLDANGFRVETTGEVRVVYPGLGMGISFARMADEDRERLRELVRSLAPRSAMLNSSSAPRSAPVTPAEAPPAVANPGAVLQAITDFFKDRHVMGRDEFLKILRQGR